MALALDDRWVWDFWLARDGDAHHLFFLQAPKSVGHPDARHWNASIGHAVSVDLRQWELLPDAIVPGEPGSWDDASTWTGSVLPYDGRWHMLYTGTSTRDDRLVQRIGLATSDDLLTWTKHDGPVLEANPRWYERLDRTAWFDEAWRDPWVWRDDDAFHMLLTARAAQGDPAARGVIAHATSDDLVSWHAQPPVTAPMGFGQMEVPQLVEHEDHCYLVFCSDEPTQSPALRGQRIGTGTFYLRGKDPLGPYEYAGALEADDNGTSYAGRLHTETDGSLVFLAWHRTGPDGTFVGAISDPRPVRICSDGRLEVQR